MKVSTGEGAQMGAMEKDVSDIAEGGRGGAEGRGTKGANTGEVRERSGTGRAGSCTSSVLVSKSLQ